jgi:hypothetical protein
MRKILITLTVIALILSIVGTGVIVSLEVFQPISSPQTVSAE